MANEKQRRRKAKEKRHAYDLVEIDGEGNETVLSASELKVEQPKDKRSTSGTKSKASSSRRGAPQPPSWRRVMKRTLIVVPLIVLVVILLGGGKVSTTQSIVNAIPLLALFIPLSYVMDAFVWRTYQKRQAKSGAAR